MTEYPPKLTPTCGNCKFWDNSGFPGSQFPNYGECKNDVVESGHVDSRACGIVTSEGQGAWVGRYFGCIHFTPKSIAPQYPPFTLWTKRTSNA